MKPKETVIYKVLSVAAALILGMGILSGCADSTILDTEDDRLRIVCTTFPQYDWTAELIRGNEAQISLTLLMDKGGDLHNFQPSALDIARVSACDLFIYVGGESDGWVEDALAESVNPDMRVLNMMEAVHGRLVEEEHVEGLDTAQFSAFMDGFHGNKGFNEGVHGEGAGHDAHEGHDHGQEYDEHVWLSLRNAEMIVEEIAAELAVMDSKNAELYQRNCDRYTAALRALDIQFEQAVRDGKRDTLLFADRFPFRYFVEDYGLNYYAAFNGCSAETEAGFGTVAFLTDKMDALGLQFVIVLDGSDDRLARVVIENTRAGNQQVCIFNSMQSVSHRELRAGVSYLNAMEENLKALRKLLA
ncbi:MAG: metal ABC transporter substrate-binding protein [Lachnospiraceae bacterium]|nr:metal ABC transporter substrate-binding protein [Lachnospiraceae bacterium]